MLHWQAYKLGGEVCASVKRRRVPPASRSTIFGLPVVVLTTQSTWATGFPCRSTVVMTISVSSLARASPTVTRTP
jgi:hypothetical protein